jgi:glycosyltransferase involved in cell wall biosynthesis
MRSSDLLVVPSRHSYPEGMPNVIFEALSTRTPLILSNHPSFAGQLVDGETALLFHAGDPQSLAGAIVRVIADQNLYARLSEKSNEALESLYVGRSWYDLLELFLVDPKNESGWVASSSLSRLTGVRA